MQMNRIQTLYRWCKAPRHLFFITLAVLLLPNVALCFTERMGIVASLSNVLLPGGLYWLLLTLSRKPGKMIWWLFFFIFLAAFQIVLLYLFGRGIIAVDMFLNLVTTNPGEAMELLDNLVPAVATVFVVYLPVLCLGIVSIRGKERLDRPFIQRQRVCGTAVTVVGLMCVAGSYATDNDYRIRLNLYPANVVYNICLAAERTYATEHYAETSRDFRFKARQDSVFGGERQVYVMVIGETARAAEFSVYGYSRPTTPLLADEAGLVAFSNVMSQSNTTHKSVPMLMSAASAVDYDRIYREKGIIEAFREAGFHTVFISNQQPNHSFIDFFGEEADEWQFIKETSRKGENTPDTDMLPLLRNVLKKGRQKEFIVLHSYGSHFNYRERYPESEAFFKPESNSEAKATNRPQLLNAYDNTIRNTDRFLHSIIAMLRGENAVTAMLYTADHGENIFDDERKLFLHASPSPSYWELHVPFFVWLSDTYTRFRPSVSVTLLANRSKPVASSASFFHSMLGIAAIGTPVYADSLNVGSSRFHSAPRRYLNDHNKAVTLEKVGFLPLDYELMQRHGVSR